VWAECKYFNVKPGGTYSNHWAAKDLRLSYDARNRQELLL